MCKLVQQFAAFALCSALCLFATSSAKAEDSESVKRARMLFSQGVAYYDEGKYRLALDAFEEAYRLRPHPAVRVNIANCYDQLGRTSEAVYHFERYLEEAEPGTPQREEVKEVLEQLYKKMGELFLTVNPDGSKVVIDDLKAGKSPVPRSIRLAAGKHEIKVSREGYETYRQKFEIRRQEQFELAISLKQKAQTAATAAPLTASPEPPKEPVDKEGEGARIAVGADATSIRSEEDGETILGGSRVLISGALTATLGISALICAIAANGAEAQYDRVRDLASKTNLGPEYDDLKSKALSIGRQADYLWIATGFLFGGAVFSGAVMSYFLISEKSDKRARVSLRPFVGRNGAGLTAVSGF